MRSEIPNIAPGNSGQAKMHPLIMVAAIALIIFSVVGIGVMTGLVPTAGSKSEDAKSTSTAAKSASSKSASSKATVSCANCGVVQSVHVVEKTNEGSGLGAIAGGIAGAVVGHQVGGGQGKSLATVVGAVGGAVAGNKIEQETHKTRSVNVKVLMEDGTMRTVHLETDPGLLQGDAVKIVNGGLVRR